MICGISFLRWIFDSSLIIKWNIYFLIINILDHNSWYVDRNSREKEEKEKKELRRLRKSPTLFSKRDPKTSALEMTFNPRGTSPDLSDGPSISNSKGRREFSSVESKCQELLLSSPELSIKTKVHSSK